MQLKKLELERMGYGEFKGQIIGKITVDGDAGAMCMQVSPEMAKRLVDLCADALVKHAHQAAASMTADLVEHHGVVRAALAMK